MDIKIEESQPHQQPSNSSPPPSTTTSSQSDPNMEKWGTHVMGYPSVPSSHPNNQKAAFWTAQSDTQLHQPYVQYSPVDKPPTNPLDSCVHAFNTWSHKAESLARNLWQNLKTGPSVSEAAWGKVGLTAKAWNSGGFEALYKQTFGIQDPNERLKKSFACYLSTSTGPVAGTLYLSNVHVAFCSDRPLCFTVPSGQQSWSYYKVMIPLAKISGVNPVNMRENPSERYIQIVTVDGHDFWFMGFVNYEKASKHLSESLSEFVAYQIATQP
ncbi:hypothetical protein Sjap_023210 [Stephania japonica]|uniref:GRAM domain-containing protein n=1 Tax=Stephania japonica TaxID=461633 RepID=A0AAP0EFU5_9MAGN